MTRDTAVLAIHEFVGEELDGNATIEECIEWCDENYQRSELPRAVDVAISIMEGLIPATETDHRPAMSYASSKLTRKNQWKI